MNPVKVADAINAHVGYMAAAGRKVTAVKALTDVEHQAFTAEIKKMRAEGVNV